MPWAYCKNSRRGRERAGGFSPSCQTEAWPLDCVTSRFPPTDRKWRMWRANVWRRGNGGALYNLKGFHPVNWKDIIFWPGDALCEAVHDGVKKHMEREGAEEREKRIKTERKEVWSEASTGNKEIKNVCWHGFETSVVSLCFKNNNWCTFDIMKMFDATFISEYWVVFLFSKQTGHCIITLNIKNTMKPKR